MLDKLKAFFNGEINLPNLQNLVDLKNVVLHIVKIGDDNSLIKIDHSKTNSPTINVTLNVDAKHIKDPLLLAQQVGVLLQEQIQQQKKPVLEIEASDTVEEISKPGKYSQYIEFFTGKIPSKDLLTLRAAYFIREEMEKKRNVSKLVQGVSARYGTRGTNILNLCGRGYFESYIKPLYETLSNNQNFEERMFLDNYNLIVEDAPFAYFVNSHQTETILIDNLLEKIPFSKKYGQHQLAIHAIGKENIDKAKKSIEDPRIVELICVDDTEIDLKQNFLTLKIHYKEQ